MMNPSDALHKAIHETLVADAAVAELVGAKVYDRVPEDAPYPYLEIGEFQRLDDTTGCIKGSEIYVTLHAWSDAYGSVEAKRLAGAAVEALTGADLDLAPDHRIAHFEFQSERVLDDPNGTTTHAVMTFRALTEPV